MHMVGISGEGRVGKGGHDSPSERTRRRQSTCSQTLVSSVWLLWLCLVGFLFLKGQIGKNNGLKNLFLRRHCFKKILLILPNFLFFIFKKTFVCMFCILCVCTCLLRHACGELVKVLFCFPLPPCGTQE